MKKEQHDRALKVQSNLRSLNSCVNTIYYIKDSNGYELTETIIGVDPILTTELNFIQKMSRDLIVKSIQDSIDRFNKEFNEL